MKGSFKKCQSHDLDAAVSAILQAEELTKRFITFAQGGQPVRELCDIREMIRDMVDRITAGLPLKVTYQIEDDLRQVEVDKGQIRQVIRNLTTNAIESMPQEGNLRIEAKNVCVTGRDFLPIPDGIYIRMTFTDSGNGIGDNDLPHIFDPYLSTKQLGSRKGIGLGCLFVIQSSASIKAVSLRNRGGERAVLFMFICRC